MLVISNHKQNTPEWLAKRDGLYTGSNALEILKNAGKISIVDGQVYNSGTNIGVSSFGGNEHTRHGHAYEYDGREIWEEINGKTAFICGLIENPSYPGAGTSPDWLWGPITAKGEDEESENYIGFEEYYEHKALSAENHLKNIKYPDPKYIAQANFGALISASKKCFLVFTCDDPKVPLNLRFKVIDVTNKNIQKNIRSKLK